MTMLHAKNHTEDMQAMQGKYEKAAIDHDREQIDMLRKYLVAVDPDSELEMIGKGKTVTEWAMCFISRNIVNA